MDPSEDEEFSFKAFTPTTDFTKTSDTKATSEPIEVISVDAIVLNIYLKFPYSELEGFVDELLTPNEHLRPKDSPHSVSTLHLYALASTREPIDMSNQSVRTTYRPNLFTRKNDAFGPWNFNFLLTLIELDYQRDDTREPDFPKVWKTTPTTRVRINRVNKTGGQTSSVTSPSTSKESDKDDVTLIGLLKAICRQNKCDESDAMIWLRALKEENIGTIEHLRQAAASETCWEKLSSMKYLVKQMIRDYVQLNAASHTFNSSADPYQESKATLLSDIHRVRRYFHHVMNTLKHVPYLDRRAVDLAIQEIRRTYDDDGNVLNNIHAYLRTFCLRNVVAGQAEHEQQRQAWRTEQTALRKVNEERRRNAAELHKLVVKAEKDVQLYELRLANVSRKEAQVEEKAVQLMEQARTTIASNVNGGWMKLHEEANKLRSDYKKEKHEAQLLLDRAFADLAKHAPTYQSMNTRIVEADAQIQDLDAYLQLDLAEQHGKLTVKYGRGLLLYGPPGTGKSEILKRAAVFAGITMTTTPLAAGELNRPYVGETERLLVDIMYRANTIPYLICAMTIDEIDGLVPKRDNNAQQSKVDGISVLLSHIEGVKNIPNLIVFGATNRRNMMDEAFLRRMQAKCFVGRPSPQIRKKMLQPLFCKDSKTFTGARMDFLVKVTTNFSGAAVGALKSSIIVAMDQYREPGALTDHKLLELADNAAREFSCWFGIGTLPEICRLYPNIFSSTDGKDDYSLKLPSSAPSGRILVDLEARKCLIEMTNEPTMEKTLGSEETSTMTLLSRFINGCSSRNIDTIQIVDLNFLTKHNALDENQTFELLTTTFLECDEYNRSMLIFDIDSLIMLSVSDSQMSKSLSISNIRLYQFIRQKCKTAIVERPGQSQTATTPGEQLKEKWIVMIVKHPLLRSLLFDDIEFKKTHQQIRQERDDEEKRLDDESVKKCPKCLQNYIPSQTSHGNCHYHDGFVFDLDQNIKLTNEQAQAVTQKAKLLASTARGDQQPPPAPKLIWACCLGLYGGDPPCQVGICGLPEDLKKKDTVDLTQDQLTLVEQHFMNNQVAAEKVRKFVQMYKIPSSTNSARPSPTPVVRNK